MQRTKELDDIDGADVVISDTTPPTTSFSEPRPSSRVPLSTSTLPPSDSGTSLT